MSKSHDASAHAAMRALMMPAALPDLEEPGQEIEFNQTDRNIYAYLVYRANGARLCWKTISEIQADLGIRSRHTVCDATGKLRRAGLIEVKHRRRDSNHYRILDPGNRLYPNSGGNGATEWQQPPPQDVQEMTLLEPQGVQDSAFLEGSQDVQDSAFLKPQGVQDSTFLGGLGVQEIAHQSFNQDKITKAKGTKCGAPASRRPPARAPIPEDWQPNAESERYAADCGLPLDQTVRDFRLHYLAEGTVLANWDAKFRKWCSLEPSFAQRRAPRSEWRNGYLHSIAVNGFEHAEDASEEDAISSYLRLNGVRYGTA